jgi:N-glycosylase/DNA lyase
MENIRRRKMSKHGFLARGNISNWRIIPHAEGRIVMYQLTGKASMWWDQLVQVKDVREKDITWKEFKRYFERKYLTKRYYDRKMKEFFELKLGSMTIDEYERRFLKVLKNVPFIKGEAVKI